MPLQIRDERARNLARKLAAKRKVTMTDAVIMALEAELRRANEEEPLARRIARIADDLARHAGPNRRKMSKAEIDAMWGHS
ncbi:MAG: type II toxin-antitoxin system VapB family antitoxin [Hyphomicrobiales bacterium]|nr:type II toxin-antitoxin system VapB family antitoxin [Hyphomicrobiales bacterium]MBV9111481.1 type II toxin-antitoxin system VapB family antitoxin [Hyphomicrobiales bacterium]MBV9518555.1 type II toxin-antitoxin system VapB family antitoxin [Hyphomicrobiales bacterium]